jgi:hypothetical protein
MTGCPCFPVSVAGLFSVRPQMVDFGSEQGLNDFETAGIARAISEKRDWLRHYIKGAKTPLWAKRCRLWMGIV